MWELRSAEELWGQTVPDCTDFIKTATDDEAKIACIGPAETGKFLPVYEDGRSGVGAVMGSKNLSHRRTRHRWVGR